MALSKRSASKGLRERGHSVARSAERSKPIRITIDECFLLRARPTLELRLPLTCFSKRSKDLHAKNREWRVEFGGPASLTRHVFIEPSLKRMLSGELSIATAEGQWWFGLALVKAGIAV